MSESSLSEEIAAELAHVEAMGLIEVPEIASGVESNLVLLEQHFVIVSKAVSDLNGKPE